MRVPDPLHRARARRVIIALAALALAWVASGTIAALALTRRFRGPSPEPVPAGFRALRLVTVDGLSLGASYAPAPRPGSGVRVVLLHGNGSSRSALVDEARSLRALGHDVLSVTARAHGDSDGVRNDFGWSAREDVAAAVRHLEAREPGRPIVVVGISLGAAAALFAGPSLGRRVAGYVLVGPYASLTSATARRTERYLPPLVDDLAFGALFVGGRLVLPELDAIAPCEAAHRIPRDTPVLVIAGARDARAPVEDARCIAAGLDSAQIVVVSDLDHEEVSEIVARDEGLRAIGPFLEAIRARHVVE